MTTPDFQSVPEMFHWRVTATPNALAFKKPVGDDWQDYTWKQTADEVRQVASGLRAIGLEDEQRCAILCSTRLEWIHADLGILCSGGATTTIYPSNTPEECAYILEDSESSFIVVENDDQAAKILAVRDRLPNLKKVINIDGQGGHDGFVITFDARKAQGHERDQADPEAYNRHAGSMRKDHLATLIYTSGTTGKPKGVELLHDQWLYEGEGLDALGILSIDDVQYFWLPLAHSFGKVVEMAQIRIGFCTAVDGRIDKIVENLGVIHPTFMCAVPRIFEKVYNRVLAQAKEAGGLKWKIFNWALNTGKAASKEIQAGRQPGGWLGFKYSIATKLVFSKLQTRFGGKLRFFISGSAPLSMEMAEFFHAAGLLILEGYGLTETSAGSFVNRPDKYRFGTVGDPLPGTEVKIAPEDGEILIRGRGVMRGYHHLGEATAETIDAEGWLHTGDIGEIDADGFLRITDRKKDLIKTSGGKYVAPQNIEGKLKATCPYISQVVVHGDTRNFCSALIALEAEALMKWAAENDMGSMGYEAVTQDSRTHAMMQPFIDQLNSGLASYETIKKFALLPKDLSEEDGELTASLKLKRKVVEKKYMHLLDAFYAGAIR